MVRNTGILQAGDHRQEENQKSERSGRSVDHGRSPGSPRLNTFASAVPGLRGGARAFDTFVQLNGGPRDDVNKRLKHNRAMPAGKPKDPAAVALGRRGGKTYARKPKGLAALPMERRRAIARAGAEARWKGKR